jgi:SPP1 family predicted phage head-tail adaptor
MSGVPMIGDLSQRVTLERYVDAADDSGGFVRSFAPVARLWAKVEALDAQTQFVEQRLEETRSYVVTIRWRDDVASQMRFDLSGRKLLIMGCVDPDQTGRFLKCFCQEIL